MGQTIVPSWAQERLWFLEQLDPEAMVYNLAAGWRFEGELDVEAMERSLTELCRRHEILRTTFRVVGGELVQAVQPPAPQILGPTVIPGEELERILEAEVARVVSLEDGPLVRWRLFRLSEREHVLLQIAHHTVFDGGSYGPLLEELGALYREYHRGEAPSLAEPALQYRKVARWERERLTGATLERMLDYWRKRLDGDLTELELPVERTPPPTRSFRGARVSSPISEATREAVKRLAGEVGSTPSTVFLAAFLALLHRYSGQDDLIVATPVDLRGRPEVKEMIGCFVNTVLLRTDVGGDPSFRDLIRNATRSALGAYVNRDLPFQRLVQEFRKATSTGHTPFFRALFSPQELPGRLPELPGVRMDWIEVERRSAFADLDLVVLRRGADERLVLHFDTDLFTRSWAERFLTHYRTLLHGGLEDPERPLSRLPLLGEKERDRLLVRWAEPGNGIRAADGKSRPGTLHRLVEEAAARFPDRPAVEHEGTVLDRRGIEVRANRLAHHLRSEGVKPGTRVAVLLPRTSEMIVTPLAVMKAGGAYIPLDPDLPPARLRFMLEDASAFLVITTSELARLIPDGSDRRRMVLDERREEIGRCPAHPLPESAGPDHPAYAIYTSGSSGKPKGVLVSHRAVVSFLRSMTRAPGLCPDDRLLAITTLTFDISVLELFLPLLTGSTVILADREMPSDGRRLAAALAEREITVLQATPATWRLLIDSGWGGKPPLRAFCGGEALTPDLARALTSRSPEAWNLYGPTEATVWCTRFRLDRPLDPVPIGRPLETVRTYVLDPHGNPVPAGVKGELWVGGDQVAIGYIDRPELTRDRFRSDPFRDDPGARMYRTGDLARWRPDGTLECLGRMDHQVKVRGFRIELGEIESVLRGMDVVRQAVAGVHEQGPGGPRLVAWVAYASGRGLLASELREQLRQVLPEYMIPSLVVEVDEFPLTPSGKIDRRALPDPLDSRTPEEDFEEPSTLFERSLAEIWSEALGVARVGVRDNFFDLGGHSLLAMRTLMRMEERTGCRFEPRDMIVGTLGQFARLAESEPGRKTGGSAA